MLKLDDLLQLQTRRRRVTPRFWYIIAFVIGVIILAVLWDKLAPESLFTSPYWQSVARG